MKKEFQFDSIEALNSWFRQNLNAYKGYYYRQYKDERLHKWVIQFSK